MWTHKSEKENIMKGVYIYIYIIGIILAKKNKEKEKKCWEKMRRRKQ